MKVIRARDVIDVAAADVRPGMILAEGIVVSVDKQQGKKRTTYWINLPHNVVCAADSGTAVQVYGRLDEGMVDAFVEVASAAS